MYNLKKYQNYFFANELFPVQRIGFAPILFWILVLWHLDEQNLYGVVIIIIVIIIITGIIGLAAFYAWARAKHFGCHYPRRRRRVARV